MKKCNVIDDLSIQMIQPMIFPIGCHEQER